MSEKMMAASKGNRLRGCGDTKGCERLQQHTQRWAQLATSAAGRAGRYLQRELAARLRGAARVEEVPPFSGLAKLCRETGHYGLQADPELLTWSQHLAGSVPLVSYTTRGRARCPPLALLSGRCR